jgi:hypothetical protein
MRASHPGALERPLCIPRVLLLLLGMIVPVGAGAEVFDFDSAPIHTSLPIDLTVGTITAHLSATGDGFSIQPANQMGFTPVGFGGLCIYPNGIATGDLLVSFSVPLTQFSILYAPQELGCDNSAIMRVTAWLDGAWSGTATTTAPAPGTWPTGTLSYSDLGGFNQVVVHYDQRPRCTDIGTIFMADNMNVTPSSTSVPALGPATRACVATPNPCRSATQVRLQLVRAEPVTVAIHDVAGRQVRMLVHEARLEAGTRTVEWDGRDDAGAEVRSGVYFCHIQTQSGARMIPIIVRR